MGIKLKELEFENRGNWIQTADLSADGFVTVILEDGRRVTVNDQGVFIDSDDTDNAMPVHETRWEDVPRR